MTIAPGPHGLSHYIELELSTKAYADAGGRRAVPVSHTGAHKWVTLPWDVEVTDPDNMHSMPGGWSILKAPADTAISYDLTCGLMVQGGVEKCSTHLMAVHCRPAVVGEQDGVDNIVTYRQAAEWFVGAGETHVSGDDLTYSNTHQLVSAKGILAPGQLLRVMTDYWNAPATAAELRMVSASVYVFWGPVQAS